MKIVADENIPYVHEFFDRFGEVIAIPGRNMSSEDIRSADILLVRSVTPVNEALLAGCSVQFVGTCTIGTDHLDKEFLDRNHIRYASAPGCNAGGVVQYDLAALFAVDPLWQTKRVGVIGHGNVGARLCRTLQALEVDFCAYDPFLSPLDFPYLTDLSEVLRCEVICLHTPYTTAGPHPTRHMIGRSELSALAEGTILLNAGRGGAVDNRALLECLDGGAELSVILDVWEGEPQISTELMKRVAIATPHIAGYSFEGKLMGSAMIFDALVDFLNLDHEVFTEQCHRVLERLRGETRAISVTSLEHAVQATYDIGMDDQRLRKALLDQTAQSRAEAFDGLRKHYPERREFSHFRVATDDRGLAAKLNNIGFLAHE